MTVPDKVRFALLTLDATRLFVKECLYRAVPHPFYHRRVQRRGSPLMAIGIVLACVLVVLLGIFFINVYFYYAYD